MQASPPAKQYDQPMTKELELLPNNLAVVCFTLIKADRYIHTLNNNNKKIIITKLDSIAVAFHENVSFQRNFMVQKPSVCIVQGGFGKISEMEKNKLVITA